MANGRIIKVDDECTGECPRRDCGRNAYPYTVEGFNGYADTCAMHARDAVIDMLRDCDEDPAAWGLTEREP